MLFAEGTLNVVHVLVSTALLGIVQVRPQQLRLSANECPVMRHCASIS